MKVILILCILTCLVVSQEFHYPRPPQFLEHCIFEHSNCTGELIYKDSRRIDNCTISENMGCVSGQNYRCVTDLNTPLSMENHISFKYSTYVDTCDQEGAHSWIDHAIGFKIGCFQMISTGTDGSTVIWSTKNECIVGQQKMSMFTSQDCSGIPVYTEHLAYESVFDKCRPGVNGMWQIVHCNGL